MPRQTFPRIYDSPPTTPGSGTSWRSLGRALRAFANSPGGRAFIQGSSERAGRRLGEMAVDTAETYAFNTPVRDRVIKKVAGTQTLKKKSKVITPSTGSYAGKFKKAKKNKRNYKTAALSKGYHLTEELYGHVKDQNTVYIGHSTYNLYYIAKVIGGSLLRSLFEKAGVSIAASSTELPVSSVDKSNGWKLVLTVRDNFDASWVAHETTTVDNETFETFLNKCLVGPSSPGCLYVLYTMLANDAVVDQQSPWSIALYQYDDSSTGYWRVCASINLQNTKLSIHATSKIMVQNRTKGAEAAGYDADRIDNQPLSGKIYEFSAGDPRLRGTNLGGTGVLQPKLQELSRGEISGLKLLRAVDIDVPVGPGGTSDYQNMPVPKYWSNCKKSANISIAPGSMKSSRISHVYVGYLPTLMKRLKVEWINGLYLGGVPGKYQLIGLEEMLRTPTTNMVDVYYERRYEIGCIMTYKKRTAPFQSVLSASEANNV